MKGIRPWLTVHASYDVGIASVHCVYWWSIANVRPTSLSTDWMACSLVWVPRGLAQMPRYAPPVGVRIAGGPDVAALASPRGRMLPRSAAMSAKPMIVVETRCSRIV
jgi:hypothetical protein